MKNKIILILTFVLSFTLFSSCENDDLNDLKDIVYTRRNGADMPAYIYGNASEKIFIIVLHGGPGGSGLEYRTGKFAKELENKYAVVYWDQRGQGMSQGHYSKEKASIEEMVKDVKALSLVISHKYGNDAKLFLMGHSWGGTLGSSVMVTEDYQYLFKGWIEVDGAHDLPQMYREQIKLFQKVGKEQISLNNHTDYWQGVLNTVNKLDTNKVDFSYINEEAFEAEEILQKDSIINESDDYSFRDIMRIIAGNNPLTSYFAGAATASHLEDKGLDQYSVTDKLHLIKIPTLILWGKYDLVVPLALGNSAYSRITGTQKEIVVFDKSGHSPMDTQPEEFVSAVEIFIEENK